MNVAPTIPTDGAMKQQQQAPKRQNSLQWFDSENNDTVEDDELINFLQEVINDDSSLLKNTKEGDIPCDHDLPMLEDELVGSDSFSGINNCGSDNESLFSSIDFSAERNDTDERYLLNFSEFPGLNVSTDLLSSENSSSVKTKISNRNDGKTSSHGAKKTGHLIEKKQQTSKTTTSRQQSNTDIFSGIKPESNESTGCAFKSTMEDFMRKDIGSTKHAFEEDSKESRRKRVEIMMQKSLGLYQRRERSVKERASLMDKTHIEALVSSALSNISSLSNKEIESIALNLVHTLSPDDTRVTSVPSATEGLVMKTKPDYPYTSPPDAPMTKIKSKKQRKVGKANTALTPTTMTQQSPTAGDCLPYKNHHDMSMAPTNSKVKELNTLPTTPSSNEAIEKETLGQSKKPVPQQKQQLRTATIAKTDDIAKNSNPKKTSKKINANKAIKLENVSPESLDDDDVVKKMMMDQLPKGNDAESKRQRRLIRNRLSAQLHRERKREAMDLLQKEVEVRDMKIEMLTKELNQVKSRLSSLTMDMNALRRYFGHVKVDRVLHSSTFVDDHNIQKKQQPISLATVVSGTSSSESSVSDEETVTPPASPPHPSSFAETKKRKQHETPKKLSPKKFKALISTSLCGMLGYVMFLNQGGGKVKIQQQQQTNLFSGFESDSQHAHRFLSSSSVNDDDVDMEDPISMNDYGSSSSEWGNYQFNAKTALGDKNFVISPIEMYPSMWSVRHEFPISSPWTYENSKDIFDLRSLSLSPSALSSPSLEKFIVISDGTDESVLEAEPTEDEEESIATEKTNESNTNHKNNINIRLRGSATASATNATSTTRNVRHDKTAMKSPKRTITSPTTKSLSYVQRVDEFISNRDIQPDENDIKLGSSFVFCPHAHASLSPGFMNYYDHRSLKKEPPNQARPPTQKHRKSPSELNVTAQSSPSASSNLNVESWDIFDELNITDTTVAPDNEAGDEEPVNDSENEIGDESSIIDDGKALVVADRMKFLEKSFLMDDKKLLLNLGLGSDDPNIVFLLPSTAFTTEDDMFEQQQPDEEIKWIELVCQVRAARALDGVDFVNSEHHEEKQSFMNVMNEQKIL